MEIRSTGEDAYFAASNSENGFFSYYSECFDAARVKRVFAIKGGPGTGKSRFLREVAVCGEGQSYQCEYIYCSSDPDSLDGVILSRGDDCIALLDATAPHVYEPRLVGVREEIVNLGAFWDGSILADAASEIAALNAQKKEAYESAYRYLSVAGRMRENCDVLVSPYLRHEGIRALAARLLREVEVGTAFEARPALISSIGMCGHVSYDTYLRRAKRVFFIEDCHGSAYRLMQELFSLARAKQLSLRVSHDPVVPAYLDGMLLSDSHIAFLVSPTQPCDASSKTIRMRSFVQTAQMKPIRGAIHFAERLRRSALLGAEAALRQVRTSHFALERLYGNAMDFEAKEQFTKKFIQRLFGLQNS